MNFAEKLKQVRNQRHWTQPQMAEVLGIEQSYLSKLENDKCLPSAEMYQNILQKLGLHSHAFLADLDEHQLRKDLQQIPEIATFLSQSQQSRLRTLRRYLFVSALICLIGVAAIFAARREIIFSNQVYIYSSPGVLHQGEADNLYEKNRELNHMKFTAGLFDLQQMNQANFEFESQRLRPDYVETSEDMGNSFYRHGEKSYRKFSLTSNRPRLSAVSSNRYLELSGAILLAAGLLGFLIEWRMRPLLLAKIKLT